MLGRQEEIKPLRQLGQYVGFPSTSLLLPFFNDNELPSCVQIGNIRCHHISLVSLLWFNCKFFGMQPENHANILHKVAYSIDLSSEIDNSIYVLQCAETRYNPSNNPALYITYCIDRFCYYWKVKFLKFWYLNRYSNFFAH